MEDFHISEEQFNPDFFNYLVQAQSEVLKDRESQIFELRYGLTGKKPYKLEAIANKFNVSRERIRQLLVKSLRKIAFRGQNRIKSGKLDSPSAILIVYLRSIIRPWEENSVERLFEFAQQILTDIPSSLSLLTYLTYPDKESRINNLIKARQLNLTFEKRKLESIKIQNFLSSVIHPKIKKTLDHSEFHIYSAKRSVNLNNDVSYSGEFYSEKLSREVQYESLLEKYFLLSLENANEVIFYQEQLIKINYKNIYGNDSSYYPDILFVMQDGTTVITEIKPIWKMALQDNLVKWSALREYSNKVGFGILITDGRYTIQQIQKYPVNPVFSDFVLKELQKGIIYWDQYKHIKEIFNPKTQDFVALILKNRLIWRLSPFYLALKSET
jgi:hypothetical protein